MSKSTPVLLVLILAQSLDAAEKPASTRLGERALRVECRRQRTPACEVDPFIGTAGKGNTFPGAVVPWGAASPGPETNSKRGAGYGFGEPSILGFAQTHVSGSIPDRGNLMLRTNVGDVEPSSDKTRSAYRDEFALPGYYATTLTRYGVTAEMTATERTGITRFVYPAGSDPANVMLDVSAALGNTAEDAHVRIVSPTAFEGWCKSGYFAAGAGHRATVYFFGRLSRASDSSGTWSGESVGPDRERHGVPIGCFFRFDRDHGVTVSVRIGISYVSEENAKANLDAETSGIPFQRLVLGALSRWQHELGRIAVTGGSPEQRVKFYTALYHSLLHPNVFSDVNGEYPGAAGKTLRAKGHTAYTLFSLWDTFRTLHPLLALAYPERDADMVWSLVDKGTQTGWLPLWEIDGKETNNMIGDHSVPVIVDAYLKGIRGFDHKAALDLMLHSATTAPPWKPGLDRSKGRSGIGAYIAHGFIPEDDVSLKAHPWEMEQLGVWGSVSTTLEYAFDDFCISRFARAAGEESTASIFAARAMNYRNVYDPDATYASEDTNIRGFMRPRNANGTWFEPFEVENWRPGLAQSRGFTEANAWQYTFFAPQDVGGLIHLMGGPGPFVAKLQAFFDTGNYTMSNEPDFGAPYLFSYVPGEEWRTARQVRRDADTFRASADGLPGNDDAGALSSLLVFDSIGIYPLCPCKDEYVLGSPQFPEIRIKRPGASRDLVIRAAPDVQNNPYVRSIAWNGVRVDSRFLPHSTLARGGTLSLRMSQTPPNAAGPR